MRAVIQRVKEAKVKIDQTVIGEIGEGMVILLGVANGDTEKDAQYLAEKITHLRIFAQGEKEFDRAISDNTGEILVVPQFTLYADCHKGRRPDFTQAAPAEKAKFLYETFIEKLKKNKLTIKTGEFGAEMLVEIHNDGPVTIIFDTKQK